MTEDELEEVTGAEWLEWYRLTPQERWRISHEQLWPTFLLFNGRLGPEVDTESPFHEIYVAYGAYEFRGAP